MCGRGDAGTGTYANERKVAVRIDSNAHWGTEFGAADERAGLSGPGVNLPDAMVFPVLDSDKRDPTLGGVDAHCGARRGVRHAPQRAESHLSGA